MSPKYPATLVAIAITFSACGPNSGATSDDSAATTAGAPTESMADDTSGETAQSSMSDDAMPDDSITSDSTTGDSMAGEMDGDSSSSAEGTIVEVAAGNPDFSILVAAVDSAGLTTTLSDGGPYTLFAPTDEAFESALSGLGMTAEELLADDELLTSVLTYHVLAAELPSSGLALLNGQQVQTVNGASVTVTVDASGIRVDGANVTNPDIAASNGVIHVIDQVLLPPSLTGGAADGNTPASTVAGSSDETTDTATTTTSPADTTVDDGVAAEPTENLIEVANGQSNLSTFITAVGRAGLFQTLAIEGPFTIFAPSDQAFDTALNELGITVEDLLADNELLTKVLSYHVVPGEYRADAVIGLDGQQVETLEGSTLNVTIDGGAVKVGDATVIKPDLLATNGVIHVIDTVLLPPSN